MDNIIQIDVKAILAAKAGKKAKYIPGFVISYLKKIMRLCALLGTNRVLSS